MSDTNLYELFFFNFNEWFFYYLVIFKFNQDLRQETLLSVKHWIFYFLYRLKHPLISYRYLVF